MLKEAGFVPVVATVAAGEDGGSFNVNADSVACALASALNADAVVFVTNVAGVMADEQVLPSLSAQQAGTLIKSQVIRGGMVPKVRAALDAVKGGARAARITDLAGLASGGGTMVVSE